MPDLFGIDIAGLVYDNMADGLLDATLHVRTPGVRTPGDPTAGTNPTEVTEGCKGFVDDYTERQMEQEHIRLGDRKVLLLGKGLTPPKPDDYITIESVKYAIVGPVKRDPAAATFVCQCRKIV